jgi:hypothetical protein
VIFEKKLCPSAVQHCRSNTFEGTAEMQTLGKNSFHPKPVQQVIAAAQAETPRT